jgi:preprotein translocase subunit YajC
MSDGALISAVFVGVVVAFYLMFFRPIQKEQARHKQEIRQLKPGDEVLTTGGFFGRIKDIQIPESGQPRIFIELADGVTVKALTNAIAYRLTPAEQKDANSEQRGLAQ